jgi:S1-C subfamily serine protease
MKKFPPARAVVLAIPFAMAIAACGGGGGDNGSAATTTTPDTAGPTSAPAPTTDPSASTTEAPDTTAVQPVGIASYADVQPAVIQIEAKGTFRDPEVGFADGSGRGSGFIISPDGLAVTNNHVVAGAATLEVFVGGDTDKSYNATILGVSECNDLALIDINESEPLPTLDWYDGDVTAGLDVYAAGFPLGDPEFTLTRGIIAKAQAGSTTPSSGPATRAARWSAPTAASSPSTTRAAARRTPSSSSASPPTSPSPSWTASPRATSSRSASTGGRCTTRSSISPASGSPGSRPGHPPPTRRCCPATSSRR